MRHGSFLDRPAARLVSAAVFLLCLAALAYIHRDDLFPAATESAASGPDPFARCYADSVRKIDKMVTDGLIGDAQAQTFRTRAEARCRAQTKTRGGVPGAPPGAPR